MKDLLTPKQVSNAIEVSESSVKRWCDKGIIPTRYTAGGHRRIPISGLLQFLRSQKYKIAKPELLGLPSNTGQTDRIIGRAADSLVTALVEGQAEQTRRILIDLYLAEHSISAICDQVIAPVFQRVGELWECGSASVFQERQGCEFTLRVLHEMRGLVSSPSQEAPTAIGAAPEGDQYNLATTMAELVLCDAGWNATSLGDNLPLDSLGEAINKHRPQLFWLSCSHLSNEEDFLREYNELYDEFGMNVAFVVGGRALPESLRKGMRYAAYCDNMEHLRSFAQTIMSSLNRPI